MKVSEADRQLTLRFESGISDAYETCREYVAHRLHHQGRQQKSIAADMDLSPSHLSRKLAQSPGDTMRFTVDDLERFVECTGDTTPILYLVEKYLASKNSEIEELERRLAELRARPVRSVG